MNDLEQGLINISRIAPINGYINSDDFRIIEIKENYNISNYYLVEMLERLESNNLIKELHVNYDNDDMHILSFKFK